MNSVLTRRATIIALLFIFSPVIFAAEKRADPTGSNLVELHKSSSVGAGNLSPNPAVDEVSAVDSHGSVASQNKDKLTVFFAIGLVINITMMSLFGVWAVRQWRKSDKRG
ncbi:MAG: hypothetical protein GY814_08110 [Gammaproteobacteria bacterium]|nr:hypothetical protein [Gammaproteobacteria bacterium]